MAITIPFSEACERNKDVILEVIHPILEQAKSVLEIGSGTGQHAIHFAASHPNLIWQTSDQRLYLRGLEAQVNNAGLGNVKLPIELNVNQGSWDSLARKFDVIYTANTFHIMSWSDVQAFFGGLSEVASARAVLVVYGPFKYAGKFTSPSNQAFDDNLRSRQTNSAIRNFEDVNALAKTVGYELLSDTAMPANNQCLVWQRTY